MSRQHSLLSLPPLLLTENRTGTPLKGHNANKQAKPLDDMEPIEQPRG
jgi:hypothetical protein